MGSLICWLSPKGSLLEQVEEETEGNWLTKVQLEKRPLKLEMWANAQRDGRPAEYRWRPLFNTAKFG